MPPAPYAARPPPPLAPPQGGVQSSAAVRVAVAASWYLVPALHAAARELRRQQQHADPPATSHVSHGAWHGRVEQAPDDYAAWRHAQVAAADGPLDLPSWSELVSRIADAVSRHSDWPSRIVPGTYIDAEAQESLLGLRDGILPAQLLPLQRWAGARLQFHNAAESPPSTQCPHCEIAILGSAPSSLVRCAGPCSESWHRGCVIDSIRSLDPTAARQWDPLASAWRCVACSGETANRRTRRPRAPQPATHLQRAAARAPDPPHATTSPAPPNSVEPQIMTALDETLRSMSPVDAWSWVLACREAAPGPARRYLPAGAPSARGPPASRRLAVAVTAVVLRAALDGNPAAQIISLHLPRVFLRRGAEIRTQIRDFVDRQPPPPTAPPHRSDPSTALATRLRQWCHRVDRAQDAGDVKTVARLLLEGPADSTWPEATRDEWLERLFPHQPDGEAVDEPQEWRAVAASLTSAAPSPDLRERDVLRWARARRAKAADAGGWSGQLILDLSLTDPHAGIASLLARIWSAPPAFWRDSRARNTAFRSATGVLLRQHGKDKPRPIAAPCVPRRIASAADARLARTLASAYCEARGQVGLSNGGPLSAYSIFPRLIVEAGGTSCSADNTASFQTFTRRGLLEGIRSALTSPDAVARPESACALARLMSRYVFDDGNLPRTQTSFVDGRVVTSHALAQGCSASPTAEAVVLATAPRPPLPPGAIRKSAHDDSQASILPGVPITSLAPPEPWGGSVYNTAKSVAVGPLATEAVRRGYATTASPHASVFGAPIGDVTRWASDVWLPKWRRQCAAILRIAEEAPDVAVLSASLIRGPGQSAAHWLRLAPCTPPTREVLATADREWTDVWIRLAGHDPTALPEALRTACEDRLFAPGQDCLDHLSASDIADARYWTGLAQAWPTLAEWAEEMRSATFTPSHVATLAGVPPEIVAGKPPSDTPRIVNAWLRKRAADADLDLSTHRWLRRERLLAQASHGASSSVESADSGSPNLLTSALRPTAWGPAGTLSADGRGAPYLICRIFGLPVWPALGMSDPTHCKRCRAPASSPMGGEDADLAGNARAVRAALDAHGEHIAACASSGPTAGAKWRHDALARDLAHISNACGRDGRYHDGPLFSFGPKSRPADLLELGHICIDVTIGSRRVASVTNRERDKSRKYAPQMALHPHLRFRPLAIDHDGDIGPEGTRLLREWSKSLAVLRSTAGCTPGDPFTDVTAAAGRAFARGLVAQARAWLGHGRGVA